MRLFKNRVEKELDKGNWGLWRWFDIVINGELYLTRLTLFKTPWFSVKLHWIHKADPDRDLHDHPWSFASLILRGWYKELVCRKPDARGEIVAQGLDLKRFRDEGLCVEERLVRWFNHKDTRGAHRILEVSPKLITLVVTGPKTKEWGFYDEDTFKYTDWKTYIATQQKAKM
jgi:hypothetical protein